MPAVSPTMTEGKILAWKIKPGDKFDIGDALFSIETDKAAMDY
jgi:pyruvate dehydrogenase E2 component (dihydrolipoamide acetyltransferase)